jgi:tetratricopeptide (TPR) repeat protein
MSGWYDGEVPVAEVLRRCEAEIARTAGDWMVEAAGLSYSAGANAMQGEFDRAREMIEQSLALCGEFRMTNIYPTFERRDIEMLAGDYEAAEAWLREALGDMEAISRGWGLDLVVEASIGLALCAQDRYDEAERSVPTIPAERGGLIWAQILPRRARARALARLGRATEAERLADEAVAIADQTDGLNLQADSRLDRADVLSALGRDDDAARDVDAALALYERKGNLVMAGRCRELPTHASPT